MIEGLAHYNQEDRPWGNFERFTKNEKSSVKIITIEPHQKLSLQKHAERSEFWKIISGTGTVTIGEEAFPAQPGSVFFTPVGTLHRAQAGETPLEILEISLGNFNEDDIERIEDDYGRN